MRHGWTYAALILIAGVLTGCSEPQDAVAIKSEASIGPAFIGSPAVPKPVAALAPLNPQLADRGRASMHSDGASSDVHMGPGLLGHNVVIKSRQGTLMPGGQCAIQTFSKDGKLVVLCASVTAFQLHLLEPKTLALLAQFNMPSRPSTFHALVTLDPDKIMSDTSGAYFYLDAQDHVVIADAHKRLRRIGHRQLADKSWEFFESQSWDLKPHVPDNCFSLFNWFPRGECDRITAVMPGAKDGLIWWVTRQGRVGTLRPGSGAVQLLQLPGEQIQNGFSAVEDGVYIASDHAIYRFEADAQGKPRIGWREAYARSSSRKTGAIDQGTGTTPTLLGDYVALTDNADGRINLLVYRRLQAAEGKRLICKMPLFDKSGSAAENSPIGWGRSIIVENNFGYQNAITQSDWSKINGGITRIDIREDESGCDVIWHSREKVPSVVAKLSAEAGLAYYYTFMPQVDGKIAWYLTALDFWTGRTMFKIRTGVGSGFDNNWSAMSLGPDGTAYVGLFKGLVAISDGAKPSARSVLTDGLNE